MRVIQVSVLSWTMNQLNAMKNTLAKGLIEAYTDPKKVSLLMLMLMVPITS